MFVAREHALDSRAQWSVVSTVWHRGACVTREMLRSLGRSWRFSADTEECALRVPGHRQTCLVDEARGGKIDRVAVTQDRLQDLRGEKAQTQYAREVGAADAGVLGEFADRFTLAPHQHAPILVRLGEETAEAVVGVSAVSARGPIDQQALLDPGAPQAHRA